VRATLFLIIFSYSTTIFSCEEGSKILWQFNQSKEHISMKDIKSVNVCHFTIKALNANFRFSFFKKGRPIFQTEVYWEEFSRNEYLDDSKKLTSQPQHKTVLVVMKVPVSPKEIDSYIIKRLWDGKIIGGSQL